MSKVNIAVIFEFNFSARMRNKLMDISKGRFKIYMDLITG